jgi:hypothetical protein
MWAQAINVVLGLWLMAAADVLDYGRPAATSDRVAGPLIATFATVALWQATRNVRRANLPFGAWLIIAPLVLSYGWSAAVNSVIVGAAVIGLSLVRGRITHRYGGGWVTAFRPTSAPVQGVQP